MSDIRDASFIADRSYQDWHQLGSLTRPEFGVKKGAFAFDVDLLLVTGRNEAEDDADYQQVTLLEVDKRFESKPESPEDKPPQILAIFEAKCFDRRRDDPPKPRQYTRSFQIQALQALAKACGAPLYLVRYKHYEDNRLIPHIGDTTSRDIEEFATALLWPMESKEFTVHTPAEYAQRLVDMRQLWAKFNAREENVRLRHEINKLREPLIDGWCKQFGIPHGKPWSPPESVATLPPDIRENYVASDSDPLAADGKFRPRPELSKYSRNDPTPHETAMLPLPLDTFPSVFTSSSGSPPPPAVQAETTFKHTNVEHRIRRDFEKR